MVGKLLGFAGRKRGVSGTSSPALVGIALFTLVLLVWWVIVSSMDTPIRRPLLGPVELANRAILVELARKCNGDVTKLHGADLEQVKRLCGPHGDVCIDILYHDPHHGDGVYQYANGQIR